MSLCRSHLSVVDVDTFPPLLALKSACWPENKGMKLSRVVAWAGPVSRPYSTTSKVKSK